MGKECWSQTSCPTLRTVSIMTRLTNTFDCSSNSKYIPETRPCKVLRREKIIIPTQYKMRSIPEDYCTNDACPGSSAQPSLRAPPQRVSHPSSAYSGRTSHPPSAYGSQVSHRSAAYSSHQPSAYSSHQPSAYSSHPPSAYSSRSSHPPSAHGPCACNPQANQPSMYSSHPASVRTSRSQTRTRAPRRGSGASGGSGYHSGAATAGDGSHSPSICSGRMSQKSHSSGSQSEQAACVNDYGMLGPPYGGDHQACVCGINQACLCADNRACMCGNAPPIGVAEYPSMYPPDQISPPPSAVLYVPPPPMQPAPPYRSDRGYDPPTRDTDCYCGSARRGPSCSGVSADFTIPAICAQQIQSMDGTEAVCVPCGEMLQESRALGACWRVKIMKDVSTSTSSVDHGIMTQTSETRMINADTLEILLPASGFIRKYGMGSNCCKQCIKPGGFKEPYKGGVSKGGYFECGKDKNQCRGGSECARSCAKPGGPLGACRAGSAIKGGYFDCGKNKDQCRRGSECAKTCATDDGRLGSCQKERDDSEKSKAGGDDVDDSCNCEEEFAKLDQYQGDVDSVRGKGCTIM